jgi:hypothetical protein
MLLSIDIVRAIVHPRAGPRSAAGTRSGGPGPGHGALGILPPAIGSCQLGATGVRISSIIHILTWMTNRSSF